MNRACQIEHILVCCGNPGLVAPNSGQRACRASEDLGRAPAMLLADTQVPTENSHSVLLLLRPGLGYVTWPTLQGEEKHQLTFTTRSSQVCRDVAGVVL